MSKIKLLVMDVDGTLTDGKIYMGPDGEMIKAFDIKDGYGIGVILPRENIIPVIITGRESEIVKMRAKELGIKDVYLKSKNKMNDLIEVMHRYEANFEQVAYIGDDEIDMECMRAVGISGCPADAIDKVKEISDVVCQKEAGRGAVREFIEWIVKDRYH